MSQNAGALTWGLVIATYGRGEVLMKTLELAVGQSRPPVEVIICDSSPDWQVWASRAAEIMQRAANVKFEYCNSAIGQQTVQRNIALAKASADILFMIDDDAYLAPTAAEQVMRVYEADPDQQIAAIGIGLMDSWEPAGSSDGGPAPQLKVHLSRQFKLLGTWFWARQRPPGAAVNWPADIPDLEPGLYIGGAQLTVRRSVAQKARFDEYLVTGYFEDSDASYRFAQIGGTAILRRPLLYHLEAKRPGGDHRKGALARAGWVLNACYLNRKYLGGSLYLRLFCWTLWGRFALFDLVAGIIRRNTIRLRGSMMAVGPMIKLTFAPQDRVGQVLAEQSRRLQKRCSTPK